MTDSKSPPTQDNQVRNARIGLRLFFVYLILYVVFLLLNAFAPDVMAASVIPDLNVAVVYGLFLIVAAFVMALLYAWLCREGRGA